ncbi:MAG TPA: hypothetical protein VFJ92_05165 [Gemmatimonadales bacterium]|jgi:hypothetical protein|nr:hypothetical protein [Gemmatimonadales bacterium]
MSAREIRAELLLGRKVLGPGDRVDARIEEIVLEPRGEEYVVREYLSGPEGFLEEIFDFAVGVPLLRSIPFFGRRIRRRPIQWDWLDLSNPDAPRLHPHPDARG